MPTIPLYDGPQVQTDTLRPTYQETPTVGRGAMALANGANVAGQQLGEIDAMKARADAWNTDAQIKTDFATWDAQARKTMTGAAASGGQIDPTTGQPAPGYAAQVQGWFKDAASKYTQQLGPAQKALITRNLAMYAAGAYHTATDYELSETQKYEAGAWADGKAAQITSALTVGTPAAAVGAASAIVDRNAQWAASHGHIDPKTGLVDQDWLAAQNRTDLTVLHASVIENLQRTNPQAAEQYLNTHSDQMDAAQVGRIRASLTTATSSQVGSSAARDVFTAALPKDANPAIGQTALDMAAMDATLVDKFKGDPVALNAARDELTKQAQNWKASEQQYQTTYGSTLRTGLAAGHGLAWAQAQPEWAKLDGQTREAITDHLTAQAYTNEMRTASAEARADRAKGFAGFQKFLALDTNPTAIAAMSDEQVANLTNVMSHEQAAHIAEKKASLKTAADVHNAVMTNDQFNRVADDLKVTTPLSPDWNIKTDGPAYQTVRANVDAALRAAQSGNKMPLTPEQKEQVMRTAMAQTVTVNPGMFSFNKRVPLATLNGSDRQTVVIPDADRQRVSAAMATRYAKSKDPAYAPTEDNLHRWYLTSVQGQTDGQ
jgi:hypothetical protein